MAEQKKKTSSSGAKKSSSSHSKASSSAKKTPAKKASSSAKREDPSSVKNTFMPIAVAFLAIIMFFCFISLMGKFGDMVHSLIFGLFSFGAWFVPPMLLTVAFFWRRDAVNGSRGLRMLFGFMSVTLISVLSHVATAPSEQYDITAFYKDGGLSVGGGAIGSTFGWLMMKATGKAGTLIITITALFLFLLLTAGYTPYSLFIAIRGQITASRSARQLEIEARKEAIAEINEENQRVAEQRKAQIKAQLEAKEEKRRAEEERRIAEEERRMAEQEAEKEALTRNREKMAQSLAGEAGIYTTGDIPASPSSGKRRKSEKNVRENENTDGFVAGSFIQPSPDKDIYSRDGVDFGVVNSLRRPVLAGSDTAAGNTAASSAANRGKSTLKTVDVGKLSIIDPDDGGDEADSADDEIISAGENVSALEGYDFDFDEQQDKVDRDSSEVIDKRAFEEAMSRPVSEDEEEDRGSLDTGSIELLKDIADEISENPDVSDNPLSDELIRRVQDSISEKTAEQTEEGMTENEDGGDEIILPPDESIVKPVKAERPPYSFPPITLLDSAPPPSNEDISEELQSTAKSIVDTLASFKVRTKIVNVSRGPTITRYELVPQEGVRVRSVTNSLDDISLNLGTTGVRMEAPIPGKQAIGIEVPNRVVSTVWLRELIDTNQFREAKSRINLCLGADVAGDPVYIDIFKMPHLLVTGATGMGKSVCINSLLVSLLYKATPDEVKLILVDPKKVELNIYNGLPHLLVPVVSDAKKAAGSLAWAVGEMERRFTLIEEVGMRDLVGYNKIAANDPSREVLPQILIIIDELADLMMMARDSVEESICRIAQKARAAGMHLIIGTQRPSVDVITGLIKANVPSRIAFRMASQVDSRTVLDVTGAEKLIGRGDMLFAPVGSSKPTRVQGAYVGEAEIDRVIDYIKSHYGAGEYDDDVIESIEREAAKCVSGKQKDEITDDEDEAPVNDLDPMFKAALELAVHSGTISSSTLQVELKIGFQRAKRIIRDMQTLGYVSPPDGQKPRTVLISREQYTEMLLNQQL